MRPSLRSRRVGSLGADLRLGQHDPDRSPRLVDHLAVLDLVLDLAQGMRARGQCGERPAPAPRSSRPRRAGRSSSDPSRGTRCRLPCGPGCVLRRTRRDTAPAATGRRTAATSTPVSSCAKPVTSRAVVDRHRQLGDPAGEDALDVLLPQPEPVGMPGGKVADVQADPGEPRDLGHLPLREEPIGDAALIEDLDGAGLQTAGARARRGPGSGAARRWRRRRPPTPARPPASAPSDRLRRSPPHARSSPRFPGQALAFGSPAATARSRMSRTLFCPSRICDLLLAQLVERDQRRVVGHRPGVARGLGPVRADLERDHDRELGQVEERQQERPGRLVEADDVAGEEPHHDPDA